MSITARQIKDLFSVLGPKDRAELERRLAQAVKRNAGPRNARDGYPTGRSGTGPGMGDPVGDVATTNVSALPIADPLAAHVEAAIGYLAQAASSIGALRSRLNAIDRLTDDSALNPEPGCWAMARIGEFEEVHRTGTVGGRLPEPRSLGRWAYRFVQMADRLPTVDECRRHNEGRRVHVRAS